jgi:hypothetical protein
MGSRAGVAWATLPGRRGNRGGPAAATVGWCVGVHPWGRAAVHHSWTAVAMAPGRGRCRGGGQWTASGMMAGHQGWVVQRRAGAGCGPLVPGAREDKGPGAATPRTKPTGALACQRWVLGTAYHHRQHPRFRRRLPPRRTSPMLRFSMILGWGVGNSVGNEKRGVRPLDLTP